MNYFMGELSEFNFRKRNDNKKEELKKIGKVAVIGSSTGAVLGAGYLNQKLNKAFLTNPTHQLEMSFDPEYKKLAKSLKVKNVINGLKSGAIKGGALSLAGYGAYRGGKTLVNKLKNRKNKRKSNFSTGILTVEFTNTDRRTTRQKVQDIAVVPTAVGIGTTYGGYKAAQKFAGLRNVGGKLMYPKKNRLKLIGLGAGAIGASAILGAGYRKLTQKRKRGQRLGKNNFQTY